MLPILFRIGPIPVASHDAFVLLGVVCALAVFLKDAMRRGVLDAKLGWIAIGTISSGAVAAKLSTLWVYVALAPSPTVLGALLMGGKSILGGLAGAYAGALVTKRLVGYRESTGDVFAPAVAVGMAIGRIGCLLSEQIGTPTALPWGISVDPETASRIPMCPTCAPGLPMHPSYAYEIVFHAGMVALLRWMAPLVPVRGDLFKFYLLSYAVFRFVVEFVRGNPAVWMGLSISQLFLIPASVVLLSHFIRRFALRAYEVPPFGNAMRFDNPHA